MDSVNQLKARELPDRLAHAVAWAEGLTLAGEPVGGSTAGGAGSVQPEPCSIPERESPSEFEISLEKVGCLHRADTRLLSASTRRRLADARGRGRRWVREPGDYKREWVQSGRGCAVCGWAIEKGKAVGLHLHHIVPLSCGGSDREGNFVVLCPNHHTLAHRSGVQARGVWTGPRTRMELFRRIVQMERRMGGDGV